MVFLKSKWSFIFKKQPEKYFYNNKLFSATYIGIQLLQIGK